MIKIILSKDFKGCLKEFVVSGHAGVIVKKHDILCAAVTTLFKTAARLIYANRNIRSTGSTGTRGAMKMLILAYEPQESDWIKGITDFCFEGINDLKKEYPKNIDLDYKIE